MRKTSEKPTSGWEKRQSQEINDWQSVVDAHRRTFPSNYSSCCCSILWLFFIRPSHFDNRFVSTIFRPLLFAQWKTLHIHVCWMSRSWDTILIFIQFLPRIVNRRPISRAMQTVYFPLSMENLCFDARPPNQRTTEMKRKEEKKYVERKKEKIENVHMHINYRSRLNQNTWVIPFYVLCPSAPASGM